MEQSLPLVSILIPMYNRPQYFQMAWQSAINQTYKHFEIVIADDSTNDETMTMIQPYLSQYPFIRYYKNDHNLGQFDNDLQLMNLANGVYQLSDG